MVGLSTGSSRVSASCSAHSWTVVLRKSAKKRPGGGSPIAEALITVDTGSDASAFMATKVTPGSSSVTGSGSSDGEADGDGILQVDWEEILQVDWEERDVWSRVLERETSEAGKDERIEVSTAQVSFETDCLHSALCTPEYVV